MKKKSYRKSPKMKVFVRAAGRIKTEELPKLRENINSLELRNFVTVMSQDLGDGYCEVQIAIDKNFATLLESSLSDGMLRHWNNWIKIQ